MKSKLNWNELSKLKLSKLKIISSREIFFVISNMNDETDVLNFEEFRNDVSSMKTLSTSFSFTIKMKWIVIVSKILTAFRNRILFIDQSIDQKRKDSFSENKKRIRSIIVLKTRKCRRKIFSIKSLMKCLT